MQSMHFVLHMCFVLDWGPVITECDPQLVMAGHTHLLRGVGDEQHKNDLRLCLRYKCSSTCSPMLALHASGHR